MSLDFYLVVEKPIKKEASSGIFIRENGQTKEITEEEFLKKFPGQKPVKIEMPEIESNDVYSGNITHNLGRMANEAGIYYALWRPDEKGWITANQIIKILREGLKKLKENPEYYKEFNAENGWGTYENFVPFVEGVLKACEEYPNAKINTSR